MSLRKTVSETGILLSHFTFPFFKLQIFISFHFANYSQALYPLEWQASNSLSSNIARPFIIMMTTLIVKQILLVSTKGNAYKRVWRISILMLGYKRLTSKLTSFSLWSIWCNTPQEISQILQRMSTSHKFKEKYWTVECNRRFIGWSLFSNLVAQTIPELQVISILFCFPYNKYIFRLLVWDYCKLPKNTAQRLIYFN